VVAIVMSHNTIFFVARDGVKQWVFVELFFKIGTK
jgi:hypothetical protein